MSKIQNFLIPSFLRRFDFWLMTHKPHIWRTKGHFVLFYCLIAAVLLYFLGRQYPQNLADFADGDYFQSNNFAGYITNFLCFMSIGIMAWWWYAIQKFGYKRTNIAHFFAEIGIYSLGIYTISLLIFGFEKGFSQRQVYELEKNKREDSVWVVQNGFFSYGYMPHFQMNKENDLSAYFKKGETLTEKFYNRQELVYNFLMKEEAKNRSQPNYVQPDDYYDTNRGTDAFSLSQWEYPSNQKKYARPPQYPKPADYVNKILSNDTFWKKEEKRLQFKEYTNASKEIMTNMTFDEISNLIDDIYPKYFNRVNFFSQTQSISRLLLQQWVDKRRFLESLSPQEISDYRQYLAWLKTNFALYAPQPILNFEQNAGNAFLNKRRRRNTPFEGRDSYLVNIYVNPSEYFDDDKGELAGEKLLLFFDKLDEASFQRYVDYMANSGYQSEIKENKKTPQYQPLCQHFFKQYTPKSVVDSLYYYDYYGSNAITEHAWLDIVSDNYALYVAQKYSDADYTRFRNLLHINSFNDVYTQSGNPTIQKLMQLHQAEGYKMALETLQQQRYNYEVNQKWTGSFFTFICCVFLAILFYITTLSNGLQFWVSVFVSGFILGLLNFIQKSFGYYAYSFNAYSPTPYDYNKVPPPPPPPPFSSNMSYIQSFLSESRWEGVAMYLFGLLLFVLLLVLSIKKMQLNRAHIWVNTLLFSSLVGILAALDYWTGKVTIKMQEAQGIDYSGITLDEKIRLYSLIMFCVIGIYALIAWLFKRHLTFPKKK